MFRRFARPLAAILVCGLAACSSEGVDSTAVPDAPKAFACSYVGGGANLDYGCVNCKSTAFRNANQSVDTELGTAAILSSATDDVAAQQSQFTIRAIAGDGEVFPAGGQAGVAVELPVGENVAYSVTVATRLNGVQQESFAPVVGHTGGSDGSLAYWGLPETTLEFNAVELVISESTPYLEEHEFKIIEFCSDGAKL